MKRCSIPRSDAVHVVERLLQRLIDERQNGNESVVKNEGVIRTNLYNLVIESWTRTSGKEFSRGLGLLNLDGDGGANGNENDGHALAARRATDILQKMEELAFHDGDMDVKPDGKSYWMVLKAWVRSREPGAVDEIDNILKRMEENASLVENDVRPTIRYYNFFLYALANREARYAKRDADRASSILHELKARAVEDVELTPDVNTYNQVLSTFAKMHSFEGAMQAQAIFDEMMNESNATSVHPNTNTFNAVMNCWLKAGPKSGRSSIERLLNTMVELGENGSDYYASPDRFSVNTAIAAVAKSNRKDSIRKAYFMLINMEEIYGVSPDTTSYNLVLGAYAKSRDLHSGKKAKDLLKHMEDLYKKGNRDVMPDSFSYSTAIDAISTRNDSGKLAEAILRRMERLCQEHGGNKPDTAVYNIVMNTYSSQGDHESVYRTQALLHYMEESYSAGNRHMKPNMISYNTALKAFSYARGNFTQEAEELLVRLENMHTNGETDVAPDVISYTSVISTYARSDVPGKAKIVQRILLQMVDAYKAGNSAAKPSVFTFNACLNACAYTFDQKEKVDAFRVAVSTLVLLQEYTKPDHKTYGTLLKAWCNLIPKDDERRDRVVNSVFRQCCKDGQVGLMVMQQLQFAASPELYRTLVGSDITAEVKISSLPLQWCRNVRERERTRNISRSNQSYV